ncbi:transposase [Roseateles sp. NT4]|uniref:transposase n=1 Tax=Roseateles sp. NT4 TaxID=3453715 RepID=UPI003EEDDB91
MKNRNSSVAELGWLDHPLCTKYPVAHFRSCAIDVLQAGKPQSLGMHWAVGVLLDGQLDPLGVWIEASDQELWPRVFRELNRRGVKDLRFVFSKHSQLFSDDLRQVFPKALALPTTTSEGPPAAPCHSISDSVLRRAFTDCSAAERLHEGMDCLVKRHKCFSDESAAATAFANALIRYDREICSAA